MGRSYLPAGPRSATAVPGTTDKRDENIYAAGVLQNSANGSMSLFTVPKGQPLPFLRGTSTATTNGWQTLNQDHTTNLEKAGELGDGIGDAAIRGLSLNCEQAGFLPAAGTLDAYGATSYELMDLQRKCSFEFRVSKKPMFKSPFFAFPGVGGVNGALSSTINNAVRDISTNGASGRVRRLMTHIMASRRDTLEGVFTVCGGASLLFRSSAADGIPTLLWCVLPCTIRGDAR
ncbi:MAG: hypothetical protein KA310_03450 [Pseudomonadales bacterium]|nr:hypothetical protein [Pseudomonadales bacterium]